MHYNLRYKQKKMLDYKYNTTKKMWVDRDFFELWY